MSFSATKGLSETLNHHDHVKFYTVRTNEGGAYNAHTGDFTVPVNGTYFFAYTATSWTKNSRSNSYLIVGRSRINYVFTGYVSGGNPATGHAVLHLVKGQRVGVESYGTSEFDGVLSFFSGFLVNPDW